MTDLACLWNPHRMNDNNHHRTGDPTANGQWSVKFGVIVRDDRCGDIFEALVGTLKAAKKRKVIDFKAELLLQAVYLAMHVYLGH
ncbi:hypothetical protein BASA50_008214 [Batrachochytrium salamandrivorans]|uniref:Costars domain-containing protein n=1 Tax=Batrachochytrium salamandrivorans TaxID=1357716 RepID=A0ABQ8F587_9FUNG|nr:hypothetical protein BASA50_008214 [Batrachochytrium salamandrivorans]